MSAAMARIDGVAFGILQLIEAQQSVTHHAVVADLRPRRLRVSVLAVGALSPHSDSIAFALTRGSFSSCLSAANFVFPTQRPTSFANFARSRGFGSCSRLARTGTVRGDDRYHVEQRQNTIDLTPGSK